MKNYFNYEAQIKSKEASEAIASPVGIGPFCGFGSATLANGVLTISPYGLDGTITNLAIKDRIRARYMSKSDDISQTTFGVVAADGAIYTDTLQSIVINEIQGSRGINDNVLVYAVHHQVTEPVENPVEFVAYWNSSSTNFYELYKKSMDPYYPRVEGATPNYDTKNILLDSELTYENLCSIAKAACPLDQVNDDTMVLVGIYGSGLNAETQTSERFAIVPYGGRFPQPISYNTAIYSAQQTQNEWLKTILNQFPADQDLITWIKDYINSLITPTVQSGIVPDGTIVLYNGSVAPDGWAICDGSNGTPDLRGVFVIGAGTNQDTGVSYTYNQRGGNSSILLTAEQLPSHTHPVKDFYFMERGGSIGDNPSALGFGSEYMGNSLWGSGECDRDNDTGLYYLHNTEKEEIDQKTVDITPPYCALNYIMKLPSGASSV